MTIEVVKNDNYLIFKRPSGYYLISIISFIIISISFLSSYTFNFDKFINMFRLEFSPWLIVSLSSLLIFPAVILTPLYVYIRDIKVGYLLKFDLLTKTILRNKKVLFSFDDVDSIIVNRKIKFNQIQNNIFLYLKNGKKNAVLFYDNENELIDAVDKIKRILNVEVKEE